METLKYVGSKTWLTKYLENHLPLLVVSPFVGSGKVEYWMQERGITVRASDACALIVNYHNSRPAEHLRKLLEEPMTKQLFAEYHERLKTETDPDLRAALFYRVMKHSYNGKWNTYARTKDPGETTLARMARTPCLGVAQRDALEVIAATQSDFLYLDPPYIRHDRYYRVQNGDDFHGRLAELLKGRNFILSLNDCALARELYDWADIQTLPKNFRSLGDDRMGEELLIRPKTRIARALVPVQGPEGRKRRNRLCRRASFQAAAQGSSLAALPPPPPALPAAPAAPAPAPALSAAAAAAAAVAVAAVARPSAELLAAAAGRVVAQPLAQPSVQSAGAAAEPSAADRRTLLKRLRMPGGVVLPKVRTPAGGLVTLPLKEAAGGADEEEGGEGDAGQAPQQQLKRPRLAPAAAAAKGPGPAAAVAEEAAAAPLGSGPLGAAAEGAAKVAGTDASTASADMLDAIKAERSFRAGGCPAAGGAAAGTWGGSGCQAAQIGATPPPQLRSDEAEKLGSSPCAGASDGGGRQNGPLRRRWRRGALAAGDVANGGGGCTEAAVKAEVKAEAKAAVKIEAQAPAPSTPRRSSSRLAPMTPAGPAAPATPAAGTRRSPKGAEADFWERAGKLIDFFGRKRGRRQTTAAARSSSGRDPAAEAAAQAGQLLLRSLRDHAQATRPRRRAAAAARRSLPASSASSPEPPRRVRPKLEEVKTEQEEGEAREQREAEEDEKRTKEVKLEQEEGEAQEEQREAEEDEKRMKLERDEERAEKNEEEATKEGEAQEEQMQGEVEEEEKMQGEEEREKEDEEEEAEAEEAGETEEEEAEEAGEAEGTEEEEEAGETEEESDGDFAQLPPAEGGGGGGSRQEGGTDDEGGASPGAPRAAASALLPRPRPWPRSPGPSPPRGRPRPSLLLGGYELPGWSARLFVLLGPHPGVIRPLALASRGAARALLQDAQQVLAELRPSVRALAASREEWREPEDDAALKTAQSIALVLSALMRIGPSGTSAAAPASSAAAFSASPPGGGGGALLAAQPPRGGPLALFGGGGGAGSGRRRTTSGQRRADLLDEATYELDRARLRRVSRLLARLRRRAETGL